MLPNPSKRSKTPTASANVQQGPATAARLLARPPTREQRQVSLGAYRQNLGHVLLVISPPLELHLQAGKGQGREHKGQQLQIGGVCTGRAGGLQQQSLQLSPAALMASKGVRQL